MLTVVVPSGIGDVSWLYSKLKHVGPMLWEVSDGWPHRTKPFLELLDGIPGVSYTDVQYHDIVAYSQVNMPHKWSDVSPNGGRLLIECNSHLEQGKRLEDWLPDLPCDFHYDIRTSTQDEERASRLLEGLTEPLWGISAASYRGSEAWKTWGVEDWSQFLDAFNSTFGGTIILLGGFWDDLTATLADYGYKDLVGKTSIGCMVEVLKRLTGYIGFSSGMGVIMTVLNKPTFMMWPSHQCALSTSWAPPEMLEAGTYVAMPWVSPNDILRRVMKWVEGYA